MFILVALRTARALQAHRHHYKQHVNTNVRANAHAACEDSETYKNRKEHTHGACEDSMCGACGKQTKLGTHSTRSDSRRLRRVDACTCVSHVVHSNSSCALALLSCRCRLRPVGRELATHKKAAPLGSQSVQHSTVAHTHSSAFSLQPKSARGCREAHMRTHNIAHAPRAAPTQLRPQACLRG